MQYGNNRYCKGIWGNSYTSRATRKNKQPRLKQIDSFIISPSLFHTHAHTHTQIHLYLQIHKINILIKYINIAIYIYAYIYQQQPFKIIKTPEMKLK